MRAFHYHLLIIVLFSMSCVSSSRYQSLEAHYQQLELQHADLKSERDSLAIRSESLQKTQEQLRKTEETLISFYLKHQNQQGGDPNQPKAEPDSSRIQTGRTEQAALKQRIQNLELELQQAKAAPKNKNQEKVSGKKKQDSLGRVLNQLQADLRELQNQLRNRDQEIQKLRANANIADSLLSVNQLLRIQNRNVQEDLQDQVAARQESLISQKEAYQLIQQEQDRKIGILRDSLNHLMNMHSGKEENSNAAESKIRQLEEQLELALKRQQEAEANANANQGLQQEQDLKIRVLRDSLHLVLSMQSGMEDRSKTAESKIRQLEEQLQLAHKQQQETEEKWNQAERKNKNKKSTDQDRLRQMESENNHKDLHISELQNQLKSLEQIVQTTRSQKDSLNEQLLRTQHLHADLKKESGLHQSRADSIRMQKAELLQQQARLAVLNGSLAEQSGRLAELQDTFQSLQDELHRMDLQLKNKDREYRALQEKADTKNKEVSAPVTYVPQRDSIRQLKKQIEGLQLVLAEQQYQLDKREVKLIRQTEELDSVNAELASLREQEKTPAIVTAKPDQKKPSEPAAKDNQKNIAGKDSDAVKPNANRPKPTTGKEQVSPPASKPLEKPKIETGSQKNTALPAEWASKVEQFVKGHPSSEVQTIRMDQSILVLFPKNALFDGDSHAMKQSGTELITAMADLLRPHARLRISIAALGFEKKPGETLQEQSLKRARTVGKLFSIYGWPAEKLRIQEKTHQSKQDQPATGSRVEIYIYAD